VLFSLDEDVGTRVEGLVNPDKLLFGVQRDTRQLPPMRRWALLGRGLPVRLDP
jgi:hypothetical protein